MSGIIVHDWLERAGGAENVFHELTGIFPDAERWCLWNDSDGRFAGVHETVLARTPLRKHKAGAVPLMPWAWRRLPRRDADWVLCSSHAFAHHARFAGPARNAPKLVYAHTPARYVWTPQIDRRGEGVIARAVSAGLRPLDRRRAAEPVAIAANSRFVAERIRDCWNRDAEVIYPPVDVARVVDGADRNASAVLERLPAQFLLGVSRFVPYKRLERVIDAGVAADMPVVLAGSGPHRTRLQEYADRAHGAVTILDRPDDAALRELLHRASALVFPAVEDFGIVPVEAMAAGTPVITADVGGAAESVLDGRTGVHVHAWERDELAAAVGAALRLHGVHCVERAHDFTTERFQSRIRDWVRANTAG